MAKLNRKDMLEGQLVHHAPADEHSAATGRAPASESKGPTGSAGFAGLSQDETSVPSYASAA